MKQIILTGIRATGIPHIGNYYGSIKPLMELQSEYRVFQLIADLHAIPHVRDPAVLNDNVRTITAVFLSCGLNTEQTVIWRQSQIKEMALMSLILMSLVTAEELEGIMDISHNQGMDMVSCLYPALMASDTLMMGADQVFAGRDHLHGLEFIRKLSQKYNAVYGDILLAPEPVFPGRTEMVRGLDGRKMSKSMNNTISIIDSEELLHEKIMGLKGENKAESYAIIMDLLSYAVSEQELNVVKEQIIGMDLQEAKKLLFVKLNEELKPIRSRFEHYINQPAYLDRILLEGLQQAETQAELRKTAMLRSAGFLN